MRTENRITDDTAIRDVEKRQRRKFRIPALGVMQAMKLTLRTMLSRAVTVQYPEERIELPERTRGVIALLEENCTVCMLCSKECPCWCIYIEGHKEAVPGKRKAVNALDRFAIDYGLCMYCGICVEVCPFDALHWSPFFEYTSYTYEGMVHESEVLQGWEEHVLPPPLLVADADEKNQGVAQVAHDKREEGIWAVIREADKKEAYKARQQATLAPTRPSPAAPAAPAPAPAAPAPPGQSSDTPPEAQPAMAAEQAPASPAPDSAAEAAAPQAPEQAAAQAPAADTGDVPRIDVLTLPGGIGPVERGRLKKLAVFQERGTAPPADLIEKLKPVLDQMRGQGSG
jgi:NADH-quinone oxidoreductase subunit I